MARILTANPLRRSIPGFRAKVNAGAFTGNAVGKSRAAAEGVRRVFARNPADGTLGNVGTSADLGLLGTIKTAVNAVKSISPAGTSKDILYTARVAGTVGNTITVAYVNGGASQPLTVSVVGTAITVNLATDAGSVITSTGQAVRDAVNASAPAMALLQSAEFDPADAVGVTTGLVAAVAATNLAGGTNATNVVASQTNDRGAPDPTVLSGSRRAKTDTHIGVVTRAPNRSIRRTNS